MRPPPARPPRSAVGAGALPLLFILLVFYWSPLLAPDATIQWNAVDLHYPAQQFFSDQLKAGHLPHWTNYVLAGFPVLTRRRVDFIR